MLLLVLSLVLRVALRGNSEVIRFDNTAYVSHTNIHKVLEIVLILYGIHFSPQLTLTFLHQSPSPEPSRAAAGGPRRLRPHRLRSRPFPRPFVDEAIHGGGAVTMGGVELRDEVTDG